MSKVNLRHARIVEFNRFDGMGWQLTVIRIGHGASFRVIAVNNDPEHPGVGNGWTEQDIHAHGVNITVLAEFPTTLADLIPEGCTRFECFNNAGTQKHYVSRANHAWWTVSDDPMEEIWRLEDAAEQFDLDLRTVVPLTVHPGWGSNG